jgi:hypothetical protein
MVEQLKAQIGHLQAKVAAVPQIRHLAVLLDDQQQAAMLVTMDPQTSLLQLQRLNEVKEGREDSMQLWALDGDKPPRSLGVIESKYKTLQLPAKEAALAGVGELAWKPKVAYRRLRARACPGCSRVHWCTRRSEACARHGARPVVLSQVKPGLRRDCHASPCGRRLQAAVSEPWPNLSPSTHPTPSAIAGAATDIALSTPCSAATARSAPSTPSKPLARAGKAGRAFPGTWTKM